MLKRAALKNRGKYEGQVQLVLQDVLINKLPWDHFDCATCAFGLKTFSNDQLQILAQEVKRILKPGGQFSFIEVSQPENRLLKFLYGIYLGGFIPILGTLLYGRVNEYKMLWRYTKPFKNATNASLFLKPRA